MKGAALFHCRNLRDRESMRMRKMSCCLFPGSSYSRCFCLPIKPKNPTDDETKSLIKARTPSAPESVKLKDLIVAPPTLASQLKPKKVVLRVSMHCHGCARQVEKRISKIEGVIWYEVDFETKLVTVSGDVVPVQVLEIVSKVKYAEIWEEEEDGKQEISRLSDAFLIDLV